MRGHDLCHGRFWGLRRLADDEGRFMLLDLRGATGDVANDLMVGLAPFATGVILAGETSLTAWRRFGSAHVGRADADDHPSAVDRAQRSGADAVLAGPEATAAARARGLARLGSDADADIGIDSEGVAGRVRTIEWSARVELEPDNAGYLAAPSFWQGPLREASTSSLRRRLIADDVVPQLQRWNGLVADLPVAPWIRL